MLVHPGDTCSDLFRHRDEIPARGDNVDEVEDYKVCSRFDEVLCKIPIARRRAPPPRSAMDENNGGRFFLPVLAGLLQTDTDQIEAFIRIQAVRVPFRRAEFVEDPISANREMLRILPPFLRFVTNIARARRKNSSRAADTVARALIFQSSVRSGSGAATIIAIVAAATTHRTDAPRRLARDNRLPLKALGVWPVSL